MTYMPDKINLARMMTVLDLEFEKTLNHHDEGYVSDNDYGLLLHIMRLVHTYSVFSAEASFNPADYTAVQSQLLPISPKCPKGLSFQERVCQRLTIDETPTSVPEADS